MNIFLDWMVTPVRLLLAPGCRMQWVRTELKFSLAGGLDMAWKGLISIRSEFGQTRWGMCVCVCSLEAMALYNWIWSCTAEPCASGCMIAPYNWIEMTKYWCSVGIVVWMCFVTPISFLSLTSRSRWVCDREQAKTRRRRRICLCAVNDSAGLWRTGKQIYK